MIIVGKNLEWIIAARLLLVDYRQLLFGSWRCDVV
jgi:hypothetical protein